MDARKRLLYRDLDVGVRLVIAQGDVEARPVFLDQVRFENERVRLAGHDDGVEVGNEADEVPSLYALELIIGEVAAHPRAQALCLANVEGTPVPSLPEINTRPFWKMGQLCGDSVRNGDHV